MSVQYKEAVPRIDFLITFTSDRYSLIVNEMLGCVQ